jgi:hypothetical protein
MPLDDDFYAELLSAAMLGAPCATATCQLSAEPHRWYVEFVHLADGHVCPFHTAAVYPRYFVSVTTLLGSQRDVLASSLNAWLSHLHSAITPAGLSDSLDVGPTPSPDTTVHIGSARRGVLANYFERLF